jgi:hypothetical protein
MGQQRQIVRVIELGVAQVNINARDIGLALAALAQEAGRNRVDAATIADITDSSGGTAGALVNLFAIPEGAGQLTDAGAPTLATLNATYGAVYDGQAEIAAKVNAVLLALTGAGTRAVTFTGSTADGTIGAIPAFVAAANGAGADYATTLASTIKLRNNFAALTGAVNFARIAVGLAPIEDRTGGIFTKTLTAWELEEPADSVAAVGFEQSGAFGSALAMSGVETAMKNNIATLAAAIDETTNASGIGPFVVATHNPATRMMAADVTL